ncbi:TetR/AcrR family transcriptional regulator [Mycolicibacterium pyrenivorans]|uniref:TetR/AcrR family transcriptional regulator n=1 Tax=Mycolicibacterium pyrenivorans TaxID=187102 RepID=UPI0023AB04E3
MENLVGLHGILAPVKQKSLRWGDATPAQSRDVARDRLLDAAETCLQGKGLSGTTMDDIASRAGVSRATVYRYFPSREAVVSGVIVRAAERYLHRISGRISAHCDLGSAILDFVAVTVRAARREPIIGLLFGSDDELAGVGLAEGTSVALFELVAEFLRPVFAAHWDQLEAGVSVDDAAEWILRTILSLLSVRGPRHRSPEGVDAFLRRFLLPALLTNSQRCVDATTTE